MRDLEERLSAAPMLVVEILLGLSPAGPQQPCFLPIAPDITRVRKLLNEKRDDLNDVLAHAGQLPIGGVAVALCGQVAGHAMAVNQAEQGVEPAGCGCVDE